MTVSSLVSNLSFSRLFRTSLFLLSLGLAVSSTPHFRTCPDPSKSMIRSSLSRHSRPTLGPQESQYLASRRSRVARAAYAHLLQNVQNSLRRKATTTRVVLPPYLTQILGGHRPEVLPRTGFAVSGGSLRATLFSLGVLSSFEAQNPAAVQAGTAGLFNAADYLVGLSGGSWSVVALTYGTYNLASGGNTPQALNHLLPQFDIFTPGDSQKIPGVTPDQLNEEYLNDTLSKMAAKSRAGFPVTIADFFGLCVRFHTLGQTTQHNFFNFNLPHGVDATFSGIRNLPEFQKFELPYPIVTALGLSPGQDVSKNQPNALVPITSNQYEFTPYETGSWDANLASFIPTEYLGTRLRGGIPENPHGCVQGFDQTHFINGISSDLFATYNTSTKFLFQQSPIKAFVHAINASFAPAQPGISIDTASVPNPFFQSGSPAYLDRNSLDLRLLDGGLDGGVTPYYPLLTPARRLDVIVGIDSVGLELDTVNNYATGGALKATLARASLDPGSRFPRVPKISSEYMTLRNHPNFFGCEEPLTPLVVWLPNSAPLDGSPGITNSSISRVQYPTQEALAIISASAEIAYRGKPSPEMIRRKQYRDPLWPVCLACAVADRSRSRLGVQREGVCADCFQRYCWRG